MKKILMAVLASALLIACGNNDQKANTQQTANVSGTACNTWATYGLKGKVKHISLNIEYINFNSKGNYTIHQILSFDTSGLLTKQVDSANGFVTVTHLEYMDNKLSKKITYIGGQPTDTGLITWSDAHHYTEININIDGQKTKENTISFDNNCRMSITEQTSYGSKGDKISHNVVNMHYTAQNRLDTITINDVLHNSVRQTYLKAISFDGAGNVTESNTCESKTNKALVHQKAEYEYY